MLTLFNNAIDILQYQKDYWDVQIFQQLLAPSQIININKRKDVPETSPKNSDYPTVFSKYLNEASLDLLIKNLNEGKSLKESYIIVKVKFPNDFRNALFKFIHEEPNYSIFDKLPEGEVFNKIEEQDLEEKPEKPVVVCTVHEIKNESVGKITVGSAVYNEYSNSEIVDLFKRYHSGKKDCYDKIVKANLGLVRTIALQICSEDDEIFEDIVQEGNLGLLKAIEKFDYKNYSDFPFYAKFWIQQSIYVALSSLRYTVRFPVNQMNLHKKLKEYANSFEQIYGYPPSALDSEMFDLYDLETLNSLSQLPDDLKDVTCRVDDLDSFESETHVVDKLVHQEYWKNRIHKLLNRLDYREKIILESFYGIGTAQETLNSIGDKLNITRERARQILWKAVRRLKSMSWIRRKEAKVGDYIQLDSYDELAKVISIIKRMDNTYVLIVRLESGRLEEVPAVGTPYIIIHKKKEKASKDSTQTMIVENRKLETIKKKSDQKEYRRYVSEYDGLFVGDRIKYGNKKCLVSKILVTGKKSKLLVKNDNDILDWVPNIKERYKIIKHSNVNLNPKNISTVDIVKEAMVGDRIIYNSKVCTVIEKKIIKNSMRLIVEYNDGLIDNIPNDWNRYKVINNN